MLEHEARNIVCGVWRIQNLIRCKNRRNLMTYIQSYIFYICIKVIIVIALCFLIHLWIKGIIISWKNVNRCSIEVYRIINKVFRLHLYCFINRVSGQLLSKVRTLIILAFLVLISIWSTGYQACSLNCVRVDGMHDGCHGASSRESRDGNRVDLCPEWRQDQLWIEPHPCVECITETACNRIKTWRTLTHICFFSFLCFLTNLIIKL